MVFDKFKSWRKEKIEGIICVYEFIFSLPVDEKYALNNELTDFKKEPEIII